MEYPVPGSAADNEVARLRAQAQRLRQRALQLQSTYTCCGVIKSFSIHTEVSCKILCLNVAFSVQKKLMLWDETLNLVRCLFLRGAGAAGAESWAARPQCPAEAAQLQANELACLRQRHTWYGDRLHHNLRR